MGRATWRTIQVFQAAQVSSAPLQTIQVGLNHEFNAF